MKNGFARSGGRPTRVGKPVSTRLRRQDGFNSSKKSAAGCSSQKPFTRRCDSREVIMSPFRRIWNVVRRSRLDEDLRQEVDTHLALIEEEERAQGSSEQRARQQARWRFGSPLAYRERALDAVTA